MEADMEMINDYSDSDSDDEMPMCIKLSYCEQRTSSNSSGLSMDWILNRDKSNPLGAGWESPVKKGEVMSGLEKVKRYCNFAYNCNSSILQVFLKSKLYNSISGNHSSIGKRLNHIKRK